MLAESAGRSQYDLFAGGTINPVQLYVWHFRDCLCFSSQGLVMLSLKISRKNTRKNSRTERAAFTAYQILKIG